MDREVSSGIKFALFTGRKEDAMKLSAFVAEKYWPTFQKDICPKWKRRTEDLLRMICADLGEHEISQLPTEAVDGWWESINRKYPSHVTPNKALTRAKHIGRIAMRWGYATSNPFEDLRRKKEPERDFTFLSPTQQCDLLSHCGENLEGYQVFAKYTGGRLTNLWQLEERDISLEKDEIKFRKTKTRREYSVPLHSELKKYIAQRGLLQGAPARRVLYQYKSPAYVSRMFWRLKRKLGIDFRFHDYRHSVGAALGSKFKSGKLVQNMLGHKDPRMSLRYTHIDLATLGVAMEDSMPKLKTA